MAFRFFVRIQFPADMKKLFVLWILTSFVLLSSCQKQDSTAEQQLAQRKAELDAREQTVDEREKAVAARERAVTAREKLAQAVRAPAFPRPTPAERQLQTVSPDAAQAEAERNRRMQQLPADVQGIIADPGQNADRASKIQERLAERQRKVEELHRARMAHAVARPPAEAASPTTSSTPSEAEASGADATSASPSPTP
jgi:hypothetical protein